LAFLSYNLYYKKHLIKITFCRLFDTWQSNSFTHV